MMFSAIFQLVYDSWCYLSLFSTKLDSISWVYILLYLGISSLIVVLYFALHFASFCANHEKLHRFVALVDVNLKPDWIVRIFVVGATVWAILLFGYTAPWSKMSDKGSANPDTPVADCSKLASDCRLPGFKCLVLGQRRPASRGDPGTNCTLGLEPQERLMSSADGIMGVAKKQLDSLLQVDFNNFQRYFERFVLWGIKIWMPVFAYRLCRSQQKTHVRSQVAVKLLFSVLSIPPWHVSAKGIDKQSFKILDPQGYETSYLYEGGKLIITCSNNMQDKVSFKTFTDEGVKPEQAEQTPFVKEILLNNSLIIAKTAYKCGEARQKELTIKPLQCDPFLMVPPDLNCKHREVCLVTNEAKNTCAKMSVDDCFLVKKSEMDNDYKELYPKPRAACVTNDMQKYGENEKTQYGLCHARVVTNSTFLGLASSMGDCDEIKDLVFNGKTVRQDSLLFTTKKDPSLWTISYSSKKHTKICVVYDTENVYANFTAENTPEKLKLELTSQEHIKLLSKLKLHCVMSQFDEDTVISNFLIVYDGNKGLYKTVIKIENSTEINALGLVCKCDIPKGFICSLGWEKPKTIVKLQYSDVKSLIRKTIFEADHKVAKEYSCFTEVWVFNYPVSYDLIKVPEIGVINYTKQIKNKDFATAVPKPGGFKNGTTATRNGQNGNQGKNDNESTSGSQNNTTAIALGIVGAILAVTALIAIIAIAVLFRRRSANVKSFKSSRSTRHEPELDMSRVIKLREDAAHQRSLQTLIGFEGVKGDLRTSALKLDPKRPDYAQALQGFPNQVFVAEEWDDILAATERRKNKIPAICGYLQECRFPAMVICKKTFVFKDSVNILMDIPPTAAEIDQWRRNPKTPVALNANVVKDIHLNDRFILLQAPRLSDMELFFEMILEKKIPLIVTLIEIGEKPDNPAKRVRGRFYPYYVLKQGDEFTCANFTLTCILLVRDPAGNYETKSCKLKKTNPSLKNEAPIEAELTILSYLKWGDFSSPADCSHVLSVIESIKMILANVVATPSKLPLPISTNTSETKSEKLKPITSRVAVHCAAGLGRSGGLVAAYNIIEYIERYGLPVNIHGICEFVRQDREAAIQTLEQFMQIYWVAADYARRRFAKTTPQILRSQIYSVAKSNRPSTKQLNKSSTSKSKA